MLAILCAINACDTSASPKPLGTVTRVQGISQYNITFTFSSAVDAGQYVNGDWWVVGPAVVTSISPVAGNGRNGWQINPSSPTAQALDSRIAAYNVSLLPELPAHLTPGASLVKAVSLPDLPPIDHSVALNVAVVLSVVSTPPPSDMFRPPYFGTQQARLKFPQYLLSTVNANVPLLRNLQPVKSSPTDSWMLERFSKPQIDWLRNFISREIHPTSAMPDYGADILRDAGDAALKLLLTANATRKATLATGFVQWGIDSYGIAASGGSWPANGGHSNGRKIVMIYAALLLNDTTMMSLISNASACTTDCLFSEDGELIHAPIHANLTLFGQSCPQGEKGYWSLLTSKLCDGDRIAADPYGYIDGGYSPGDSYQVCCTSSPWKGTALPLLLWPKAREVFNDESFISYIERWMSFGAWAQPDPCAPPTGQCSDGSGHCVGNCSGSPCGPNGDGYCVLSMDGYGKDFGPDGNGGCILDKDHSDGIGRFPYRHGANKGGGDYGSQFQQDMWDTYGPKSNETFKHAHSGAQTTQKTLLSREKDDVAKKEMKMTVCRDKCHGNCKTYMIPYGVCYNPKHLFPGDPQWGTYDIIDTCGQIEGSLQVNRTFFSSSNSSCIRQTDHFYVPPDECVGPFGDPRPWGKFTCPHV